MKKTVVVFAGMIMALSGTVTAQKTYQTIASDPGKINKGYLGLTYMGVDAGFGNTSGASVYSIGADALYPINDKLKVEGLAWYSLLSLSKKGPAFLLNAGAEYSFKRNTKEAEVPVLLSFTTETDWFKGEQISAWSSVALPGHIQTDLVARGGFYIRNSALEYEENTTYYDLTNLTHTGFYLGVGRNRQYYLHVQDSDGNRFAAGRFFRTYADLLILPTKVELEQAGVPSKDINGTIGWRVGMILQLVPFTRANNFDRKISFLGNALWRLEFGQRPHEGVFVTTGLSWVLKKF